MSRKRVRPKDGHTYILVVDKEIWGEFCKVIPEKKTKNEVIVELIDYFVKIQKENQNKPQQVEQKKSITDGLTDQIAGFSENVNKFITG